MALTLPLGNPSDAIPNAPTATAAPLSGAVAIYDLAMCCSTGVCGPGVDLALLTLTRDVRWLEKHGVTVQRFGLSQEPQAFVQQPKIKGLMLAFGDKGLPATLVNGEVLMFGRYPTREEIAAALIAQTKPEGESSNSAGGNCCAPGSGCC